MLPVDRGYTPCSDNEARRAEAMNKFIKRWDKDGDGKLNREELAQYMRSVHDGWGPERGKYNINSDGKLDDGDRPESRKQPKEKHPDNGVRAHGKGQGRDDHGQGKGQGKDKNPDSDE